MFLRPPAHRATSGPVKAQPLAPILYLKSDKRYTLKYRLESDANWYSATLLASSPEAARDRLRRHIPALAITVTEAK